MYAGRSRNVEMRLLLCDYVELLMLTGIRHGTEAMRLRWQHCEWHWVAACGICVCGSAARLVTLADCKSTRQSQCWSVCVHVMLCAGSTLDAVFAARIDKLVFAFSDSAPSPISLQRSVLAAAAGLWATAGWHRRHARSWPQNTPTPRRNCWQSANIHTLTEQMGTSVLILDVSMVS